MHVEMSLDSQQNEAPVSTEKTSAPSHEDTQTISGSQVACSFGRLDAERNKDSHESWQRMTLTSLAAVMLLAGLYVAIVLLI